MNMKPPKPKDYLVWAIIVTVLFCVPLGIVSIIQSTKISSLYATGQYAEAQKASSRAKKWVIWSVAIGLLFSLIFLLLSVFYNS